MSKVENYSLSRRDFLKASGMIGGGIVVGASSIAGATEGPDTASAGEYQINDYIQINEVGEIVLIAPNVEMGQGALMGLSTLVAEEFDTGVSLIKHQFSPNHKVYGMPGSGIQITGGSATLRARFFQIREVAASAREIILEAAALELMVPKTELRFENAKVVHGDARHDLAKFMARAKTIPAPKNIKIKEPKDFKLIGKEKSPRNDAIAKSTGTAEFGIDVKVPKAKIAVVKASPAIGGKVKKFDASEATKMPGVIMVSEVFNGVAVLAESYWQARQAADKLVIEWDHPKKLSSYSSETLHAELQQALDNEKGKETSKEGKGKKALENATKTITANYKTPYLAHATMEPMNCTIKIEGNKMDLWLSTQAPGLAAQIASEFSGISRDDINVHTTFLGGGFGRRGGHDYVAQAAQIAVKSGEVVKLVWSREDDTQNDYYRPISWANYQAGIDSEGNIDSLYIKRVGPNVLPYAIDEGLGLFLPEAVPDGLVDWLGDRSYGAFAKLITDGSSVEGLYEDYDVPNIEVRHVTLDPGLRVGPWRSVGHSYSAFFSESFIDEIAHDLSKDPLALRLQYMNDERLRNVTKIAAEKAGWGRPNGDRYLGLAAQKSFGSYVAEVAEVSVVDKQIKVHKVTCVVDCGLAVNPDVVKAQMEGGIIFGLSAAMHQEITIDKGAVLQSNFHDFATTRMEESPEIEVIITKSSAAPTGVGEPGTPPIAPAVANAVFAATGQRLRDLPLRLS